MESKNKNRSFIRKISALILGLFLFSVLAYLALGFIFDRQFFARDAQEKYGRVLGATTLSIRVIGPPSKPVLSGEARCTYLGVPYIRLSWDATSDTDYYDLDRDLSPLVSGETGIFYDDYTIASETTYSYLITAFGPAGQTASDPIVVTSNLCAAPPPPTIEIDRLNEVPVLDPLNIIETEDRTPTFYGHTNIANATIEIELNSPGPIFAQTTANLNGFWDWTTPVELEYGNHLLEAMAIDPLEPSRRETASIQFGVLETASDDEVDGNEHKKKTAASKTIAPSSINLPGPNKTFAFSLEVVNPDAVVFSGTSLKTKLTVQSQNNPPLKNYPLHYQVVDSENRVVYQFQTEIDLFGGAVIYQDLALPRLLQNGRYKIIAQTDFSGTLISAEDYFEIQEPPLIAAGPLTVTLTEVISNLSWAIILLLILLLIFLALFSVEYWLYRHALIHVSEDLFDQKGFWNKRKEVLR